MKDFVMNDYINNNIEINENEKIINLNQRQKINIKI